ncbi:hypothetical protein M3Y98_00180900 [Aphelenchoides besseyi]|nr:hypothetical protein M3Y98_00180900 [Aphelenchoides besseyi]
MNRILNRVAFNASAHFRSCRLNSSTSRTEEPLWKDPFKHALPPKQETLTEFEEAPVDWKYVERLLPPELIPEMPKVDQPTPSGWRPPKDPTPDLPYYIKRSRHHMPQLHLERRRDKVNPKTMMYEYIELVTLKGVYGDLFACEKELKEFLEERAKQPIATHVDELQGRVKVRGADRSLLEAFVYEKGF